MKMQRGAVVKKLGRVLDNICHVILFDLIIDNSSGTSDNPVEMS